MSLYNMLMEETPKETKARNQKIDKILDEVEKLTGTKRPFKNNDEVIAFMKDDSAFLDI